MVILVFLDSNILFKFCDFIKIYCEICVLMYKSINFLKCFNIGIIYNN